MSDFRRSATEAKRDHDHKAKWARGARHHNSSRQVQHAWGWETPVVYPLRPVLPHSSTTHAALKRYNEPALRSAREAASTHFHHDVKEALSSDSSSDEYLAAADGYGYVADDAALPVYAFSSGNTVLSSAISTAEIKYENKVTEKLVKEYEFVSKEDENGTGYVADVDDDFEIIDHASV